MKKLQNKSLVISILLTFFYLTWVMINADYTVGRNYLIFLGIAAIVVFNWGRIPKKHPERKLFSFDSKYWFVDLGIGLIVGWLMISFIYARVPTAILPQELPNFSFGGTLATVNSYLTIVLSSPITEEIFFRIVLFGIFWSVIGWSFLPSTLITSGAFSLYHLKAYTAGLSLQFFMDNITTFAVAFIVAIIFTYMNKLRSNAYPSLGAHTSWNWISLSNSLAVFS